MTIDELIRWRMYFSSSRAHPNLRLLRMRGEGHLHIYGHQCLIARQCWVDYLPIIVTDSK